MNFKELNTKQAVKDYINNNWWFSTMKLNLFNEENNKLDISEKIKNNIPEWAVYFEWIASNWDLNRNWYIIRENAWKSAITWYMENPIVLLQHNPEKPIWKTLEANISEKWLEVKWYIFQTDEIKNWLITSLSTWHITKSIEFENNKTKEIITEKSFRKLLEKCETWTEYETIIDTWILAVTKLEWVEYSFVTIPSNRKSRITTKNALQNYIEPMKNELLNIKSEKDFIEKNEVEEKVEEIEEENSEKVSDEEIKEEETEEETEEEVKEEIEKNIEEEIEEENIEEEIDTENEEDTVVDITSFTLEELQAELDARNKNEEEIEKENLNSENEDKDKVENETVETLEKSDESSDVSENEIEKAKEELNTNLVEKNWYDTNTVLEKLSWILLAQSEKIEKLENLVANLPNDKSAILTSQFWQLVNTEKKKSSWWAMAELMKNAYRR